MSRTITTIHDAVNHIADMLSVTMEEATWIYENSDCPDWDAPEFATYDFLSDPKCAEFGVEGLD